MTAKKIVPQKESTVAEAINTQVEGAKSQQKPISDGPVEPQKAPGSILTQEKPVSDGPVETKT